MESVPSSRKAVPSLGPAALREEVERFLATCQQAAVVEPGDPPIVLASGGYSFEISRNELLLEAWDDSRNLTRRISGIEENGRGVMLLRTVKFGGKSGLLRVIDTARPQSAPALQRGEREILRERFRRWLSRQFPGWRIETLSTAPDLQRTLSPVYPRALLVQGTKRIAALCSPEGEAEADAALTYGLIWLDYLRRREHPRPVTGLALFLPVGTEANTLLRMRFLNRDVVQVALFHYDGDGFEQDADSRDTGNLIERLPHWRAANSGSGTHTEEWAHRLSLVPDVECVDSCWGTRSLRVRGLEFAQLQGGELSVGIGPKRSARGLEQCETLAAELARIRSVDAPEPEHPWLLRNPEAWLESMVRAQPQAVDASLLPAPVYGQISTVLGSDRGVIDLLACDGTGRLAVLELKVTEDPCLPVQALDYWIRIRSHVLAGEFTQHGYFAGVALRRVAPRLFLVAPSLEFHPTTEALLRFLSPEVEVERIGLGVEWQRKLRVVLRVRGSVRPDVD